MQHSQILYAKGCRWLWSSLCGDPDEMQFSRAACIRNSTCTLHVSESHSATIPRRSLGGSYSSTSWDSELIRCLNGSLHRVFACSAGGPGFDSRLRRNILRCSMQKDVDGQVSTLQYNKICTGHSCRFRPYFVQIGILLSATQCLWLRLLFYSSGNVSLVAAGTIGNWEGKGRSLGLFYYLILSVHSLPPSARVNLWNEDIGTRDIFLRFQPPSLHS